MYYYKRLKDLREDKDLTQKDIGEFLGIKQNVYSRKNRSKRKDNTIKNKNNTRNKQHKDNNRSNKKLKWNTKNNNRKQ